MTIVEVIEQWKAVLSGLFSWGPLVILAITAVSLFFALQALRR